MKNQRLTLEDAADTIIRLICVVIVSMLLVAMTAGTAHAFDRDAWDGTDTALQTLFITATVMDMTQTLHAFRHRQVRYEESNPLLGRNPSVGRINAVIPTSIIAHTAIAVVLPKEMDLFGETIHPRAIWQCFWIGVELEAVQHNRSIGLGLNLHF